MSTSSPDTARRDVLVIGEALIDVVSSDHHSEECVGGSPANVAIGVGRRGVDVALLTQIGPDARGAEITRHLRTSGVELMDGSLTDDPTSVAIARISEEGGADYEFHIRWQKLPSGATQTARVVHTGSIAAFMEPGASSVREFLEHTDADVITFDPNIRPALLGSRESAIESFIAIARRARVIKMSDEDAGWLFPNSDAEDVLRIILEAGPQMAVVTRGGAGALLAIEGASVAVDPPPVVVVDTIGAGDTFMSSLIVSLLENGLPRNTEDLRAVGEAAVQAAAVTVFRRGADLPWAAELPSPSPAEVAIPS